MGTGGGAAANGSIGGSLRRLRHDRGLTQEELAARAGLSVDAVQKLERGTRVSGRADTLIALAYALDTELSELLGKRPRVERGSEVRVLALRDMLMSPELLVGEVEGDPAPLGELRRGIEAAWEHYWGGRFTQLTVLVPELGRQAQATRHSGGPQAAPLLAQTYQLAACLLVHFGRDDLAVLGAERAIRAAEAGDDELQHATLHGTYAWALLHQGRTEAAERHALRIAEQIEPRITTATPEHLTVWGGLLLGAMAAAVAGGRRDAAADCIGFARAAVGRIDSDRRDYQVAFGPSQLAMQTTHAYAALGEPGQAISAAQAVHREDLPPIAYGRHLIDLAQAQADADDLRHAEATLHEARSLSAEWFRHQGPARGLVSDLVQRTKRQTPSLRQLATAACIDS